MKVLAKNDRNYEMILNAITLSTKINKRKMKLCKK